MAKEVIHITEAEASPTDIAALLKRVGEGAEIIVDRSAHPVAIVSAVEAPRSLLLSASIALAEDHARELGYEPTIDEAFASDLREIINTRTPRDLSGWE